jgi:hypothetical protein
MLDDFDVDLAKGQATHRPTGHAYMFRPTQPIDLVAVTRIRPGKVLDPSPAELAGQAVEAIKWAMREAKKK